MHEYYRWNRANPNLMQGKLPRLVQASPPEFQLLSLLAIDEDDNHPTLAHMASEQDPTVRQLVAANPVCPLDILLQLAQDEDARVRRVVAHRQSCPPDVLDRLARDPDNLVRRAVAGHPAYCPKDLLKTPRDTDPGVRWAGARNPNCPPEVMYYLIQEGWQMRANVVRNPNCPPEILAKLKKDRVQTVRRGVAEHRATPLDVLRTMMIQDKSRSVRQAAAENLARSEEAQTAAVS